MGILDSVAGGAAAGASGGPWGAIIGAGIGLFGSLFGAHEQTQAQADSAKTIADAQKYSAELASKGTADALAFTKSQGENAFQNTEAARQGNYGMYAAAQRRLGSVGDLIGAGPREIPAYVPGVDPNFTGAASPSSGAPASGAPASGGASASGGGVAALKTLLDGGMDPQQAVAQFNQQYGRTTGNQAVYYDPSQHGGVATIGLPEAYLAKPGSSWDITQRSGAPAAAPALKSVGSYLQATPTPYAAVPVGRALQMPGSAASYLNG